MFKYLKRISYQVNDLAKARRWYCDVLGIEPVYDSPLGDGTVAEGSMPHFCLAHAAVG